MLLAGTHINVIVGLDFHIVMVPTPAGPVPTPLPHPFVGFVFDIGDLIPKLGASVFINYKIRGCSFTQGMLGMKVHIPTPPGAAFSPKPIGHDAYNFFGSLTVKAQGNLLAVSPFMLMTCNCIGIPLTLSVKPGAWKQLPAATTYAPTSVSVPIPTGLPVLVGGPYVPDLAGMAMSLLMSLGFSAIFKGLGRALNYVLKKLDLDCTKGLSAKLCQMFGEPVDLATGRVVYTITDFELPGPLPLKWERNWYSDSGYEGILGHGVHLCYDLSLITDYNESVIGVILPDGRATAFPLLLNEGESFYNRPEKLTLTNKGDHYELKDHANQLTYIFEQIQKNKYKPVKLTNLSGFSIRFRYDAIGKLIGLVDCVGRNILIKYDTEDRIIEVKARHKGYERQLVTYAYNDNNDLASITDALEKTTRIRYQNHLMVEKTDRNGQTFYWEYDGHNRNAKCTHTYGDNGLLEGWIKYDKEYTAVTTSLGETTKYYYNELKLCTKIIDPLGNSKEFVYTEDMELYREIDEEGNITGYIYDDRGNMKSKHLPDNTSVTCLYTGDNQLKLKMDAQGGVTVYNYNDDKLLRAVTAPDGSVMSFEYNENKQLFAVKNEENHVTTLSYDSDCNLASMKLQGGAVTEWVYDIWGRCTQITNPENKSQYFKYDELGRVIRIKNFDGNSVKLKYDAYEEVILAEDDQRKVEFIYNALGSLITRSESGSHIRFKYDTQNRLLSLRNELDEVYRFERDAKGQITAEIGFDGLTRTYKRDRAGKVVRIGRPTGKWSLHEYDMVGRLTRTEQSDGTWETYTYDRSGRLTEACNENATVQIVRDKVGRVIKEICGEHWVESKYNSIGKRANISSSLGAHIDQEYNEGGYLSRMQVDADNNKAWNTEIKYNALGLEIERLLPGSVSVKREYDAAGHPTKQKLTVGKRETLHRSYTWNVNDRLTKMVNDLSGGSVSYGYDDFGNLARAKYENGILDYRMPDAVGNLYKTEERKDRKYSPGGRLLEADGMTYEYDDEGNLIQKKEKNGRNWSYQWKENGMLQQVIRPDGKTVRFQYDALGRRTAKVFNGNITRWLWNGNVPLHEWQYLEEEKPIAVVSELGEIENSKPEPLTNLISWIFDEGSFRPTAKIVGNERYSIITDYLGTPIEMYNAEGQKKWQADYDIRGKIRSLKAGSSDDCPFRYQGQYEDIETELYYNRFRYYNSESGLYISKDPIGLKGGKGQYSYVKDTNIKIDTIGLSESIGDLFRGTTEGFPGSESLQRIGITPASTDPRVATIFAEVASKNGNPVVHIASPSDLAGVEISPGNYLAEFEKEVAVELTPSEFANKASATIPADEARSILQGMGHDLPRGVTNQNLSQTLKDLPPMHPDEIERFANQARKACTG